MDDVTALQEKDDLEVLLFSTFHCINISQHTLVLCLFFPVIMEVVMMRFLCYFNSRSVSDY